MAIDFDDGPWDTISVYSSANGQSVEDATWLGHRYSPDTGLVPGETEAWVIHESPRLPRLRYEQGIVGWYTMLWRSPTRRVFVSDIEGSVHVHPDLDRGGADLWRSDSLRASLAGVWGLDDDNVFAWGRESNGDVMFRYDGASWRSMPAPGRVVRMSGISKDYVIAVGTGGLIAKWDGDAWQRIPSPTIETLSGIHVVSRDEFYACGQGGTLLEGSSFGVQARTRWSAAIHDVAKFAGEVWVAGANAGLLRLKGTTNQLECVKSNIKALSFDARGNLLITAADELVSTTDGKRFTASSNNVFVELRDAEKPMWLG